MESYKHLFISSVLAVPVLFLTLNNTVTPVETVFYYFFAVGCGTLIDIDHFLWIWYNHGIQTFIHDTCQAVKKLGTTLTDNQKVIHDGKQGLTSRQRYISHFLILFTVPVMFFIAGKQVSHNTGAFMFQISLVMITSHIVEDLFADLRKFGTIRF